MAGRTGFFGGLRGNDTPERDADTEFGLDGLIVGPPLVRLDNPNGGRSRWLWRRVRLRPYLGTLGAAIPEPLTTPRTRPRARLSEVEIFGNGFQISGQIHTGQFDRLSGWINMQSGFIAIRDALHVHPGKAGAPDLDQRKGTLRVRLSQIVMMAERSAVQAPRPGAPVGPEATAQGLDRHAGLQAGG